MEWICAGCGHRRRREPGVEMKPMRGDVAVYVYRFCDYGCYADLWPLRVKEFGPQPPPTQPFTPQPALAAGEYTGTPPKPQRLEPYEPFEPKSD